MPVEGAVEWNSAEGRVALDVVPLEVLGALTRLRVRLLQRIDAIPQADAEMPTRCTEWRAVDLVNHLADTTEWGSDAIAAALAGRGSTDTFAGFHVVTTPKQLTDAAPRDLDLARARLHKAMDANLRQVPGAVALVDRLTPTPLGPQPFSVAALHVLWDTWLHERDLFLAEDAAGAPPQHEDEVRLCALYTLRLLGLMQAVFQRERTIVVQLHGATGATLRLDSRAGETLVRVIDAGEVDDTTPTLHGDAATVVDALTGRGDIATALEGPAEARRGLSPLSRFLRGR